MTRDASEKHLPDQPTGGKGDLPVISDAMMPASFYRWTATQRIQHVILIVSFLTLMFTGLPLLLPNANIARKLLFFPGSFELRSLVHRIAAVALMALTGFHVLYLLFSRRGNRDLRLLVPNLKDLRDFRDQILHDLGRRHLPPQTGRYTLFEKFEYLAVVWGSGVMIATGLAMWFEDVTMVLFPRWIYDVFYEIHSYEAILAFLSIIIWHMFNTHLHPTVFPMNKVWLSGRITRELMKHHHPEEYEELKRAEALRRYLIQGMPEGKIDAKEIDAMEVLLILRGKEPPRN